MNTITWADFEAIDLRVGKIIAAENFAKARKSAYKLTIDFGKDVGIRVSSAQITALYTPQELIGKLIVAVINFPPKQIGPLMSECLVTGFHNERGEVSLCIPEHSVPLGARLM